jgi:glutathione reductase (NADPH)
LPERVLFIGGGYISFEFAHIAARAGARVTILHRGQRPLERFDPDLVDRLVSRTRDLGVDVRLGLEVSGITRSSSVVKIEAHGDTGDHDFDTDLVVHGAGRVPEIDDMRLNEAGIEWDPDRGVKVNEYLQSVSNPAVFAAGDAAASAGPPLTPAPMKARSQQRTCSRGTNANQIMTEYPLWCSRSPSSLRSGCRRVPLETVVSHFA